MIPHIDPKVDYAFKWLFGNEARQPLLLSLVNAVLDRPPEQALVELQLLNPFNDKEMVDDKLTILDIKARDGSGRLYNIEMQMIGSTVLRPRLLYYWAVLYADQLKEGDAFTTLQPTVSICFLNDDLFTELPEYHLHFELCSRQPAVTYGDHLAIHLVQLPKMKLGPDQLVTPLDRSYFLIHGENLDTVALPKPLQVEPMFKAMEALEMFAQDDIERERYRARLKAQRDHSSHLHDSEERGVQKGLEKGETIGMVHAYEELLKRPETPREQLLALPSNELQALVERLKQEMTNRNGKNGHP